MNTKEFEKILNESALYSNKPIEEQQVYCQNVQDYVYKNIPQKLYRYRRCDENSLNAFLNDQLWFATASKMNDDYDSMLYYDKNIIDKEIENLFDNNGILLSLAEMRNGSNFAIDAIKCIVDENKVFSILDQFRQLTDKQLQEQSKYFRNWVEQNRNNFENEIVTRLQKKIKFACFTERIDSPSMWGHYADSSKGFVLEYDFIDGKTTDCITCDKLGKTCKEPMNGMILPVIYSNKRFEASSAYSYILRSFLLDVVLYQQFGNINVLLKQKILGPHDPFMWAKIIIHKAKDWEKEKEWRIIYTNPNDPTFSYKDCSYVIKKPTAIYLGRRISAANQKFLITVAKEKGYKVYKEAIDTNNNSFKMKAVPLK